MNPSKIVAYRRTSTKDQLLGIDAQDATVSRIARERGCTVIKTFTEHESGGDNERPELANAIRHARRVKAVVVVAKLDRLARDSTFLMKLYDGNVPIIFGDLPEVDGSAAGRLIIQMMANFAEFERRRIGERTKEALAALKAQGVKLGTPRNLRHCHRCLGAKVSAQRRRQQSIEEMEDVLAIAAPMRAKGATLQAIADHLNATDYTTRNGSSWSPALVKRLIERSMNVA